MLSESQLAPARTFSREFIELHFGPHSSAIAATKLKKEHPLEYKAAREQAVRDGLLDVQREHVWAPNVRAAEAAKSPHSWSDEEILARAAFSEERCKELLGRTGQEGTTDTLSKVKAEGRYQQFKLAAVSYGLLAPSAPGAPGSNGNKPKPPLQQMLQQNNNDASAGHIAISDSLADSLRLPRGTRVPPERLSGLISLSGSIEAARAELTKAAETTNPTESTEN